MVTLGRQIRHDDQLGHAFVAGIHRRVPHERGAYFSVTNAEGFREDHDLESPPEGFHVMCYGDSYAAGDGVDNRDRFSALLARELGITVSNVAVPGHGPDQNVLQLEQGRLPAPDLILWCIAVHTIERIQSGIRVAIDAQGKLVQVGRPHFVLGDGDSLELRGVPVEEQGVELVEDPRPQIESQTRAMCSVAVARLRSRLVSLVGPYLKPAPDPGYEQPENAEWRLLAALVRRFHASAGDAPVVIVPLPTSRYLVENRVPYFQSRFDEIAQPEAGLHVVDVLTGMRKSTIEGRRGFCFRSDGHYTVPGHVAVASALAEQIRSRGLLPEGHVPAARAEGLDPRRGEPTSLHLGWELEDAWVQLRGESGAVIAEHREARVTGHACRAGALPLSAVHACLDEGRVAGPELQRIVLHSPCTVEDLAAMGRGPLWLALASGWVRWRGGVEPVLRSFLDYGGEIEHVGASHEARSGGVDSVVEDDELRWLRQRIEPMGSVRDPKTLEARLTKLACQWENATRSARELALPTSAPLRRGRISERMANSGEE